MSDYHGHVTHEDGTHTPLTKEQAETLWKACDDNKRRRAELMPTERDAIRMFFEAWQRLGELGWSDAMYCPKDGTPFDVIEVGSTGIFDCYYQGDWPKGYYMVSDGHDVYPSSRGPAMFRKRPAPATEGEGE